MLSGYLALPFAYLHLLSSTSTCSQVFIALLTVITIEGPVSSWTQCLNRFQKSTLTEISTFGLPVYHQRIHLTPIFSSWKEIYQYTHLCNPQTHSIYALSPFKESNLLPLMDLKHKLSKDSLRVVTCASLSHPRLGKFFSLFLKLTHWHTERHTDTYHILWGERVWRRKTVRW